MLKSVKLDCTLCPSDFFCNGFVKFPDAHIDERNKNNWSWFMFDGDLVANGCTFWLIKDDRGWTYSAV